MVWEHDPYRDAAPVVGETFTYDLETVEVIVRTKSGGMLGFALVGTGPAGDTWTPNLTYEEYHKDALSRYVSNAKQKLSDLLNATHATGWLEAPCMNAIIPEHEITLISYDVNPISRRGEFQLVTGISYEPISLR